VTTPTGLKGDLGPFLERADDGILEPQEVVAHYVHSGHYTGGRFDTYGDSPPDQVTGDDIVAVAMLAIPVEMRTTRGFRTRHLLALEDQTEAASRLLADLPDNRDLHTLKPGEYERLLGPNSPAWKLYDLLRSIGVPKVARYKLLARKRPRLLPISDSKVRDALNRTGNWWEAWWVTLRERPDLVNGLERIRLESGAPWLSLLRVADILVWMRPVRRGPGR
jgi:hypothetical protein